MEITLENDFLRVSVFNKGAELRSIWNKASQQEVLWNADPAFWGKVSPVLFPIVGGLKRDSYIYEEKEYHLPRHGFARDKMFTLEESRENQLVFFLKDDEETRTSYPFPFEFKLVYTLIGKMLKCTYQVYNSGDDIMFFSIGGHPAFAVYTSSDITYSDYYLEFSRDKELKYFPLVGNSIGEEEEVMHLEDNCLPLHYDLFYKDALVIKGMKSDVIRLRNCKGDGGFSFRFEGFPFFGIWAAKDANFICLEPWCGIADGVNHSGYLTEKEGIISLNSNEHFERSWSVEILG